jgi:flagellar hook-basal body complex protein FliE
LFGAARQSYSENSRSIAAHFHPPRGRVRFYSAGHAAPRGVNDLTPMDSLRLKPFDFAQAVARAGLAPNGQPLGGARRVQDGGGGDFASAMTQALKTVSANQLEATRLQRELQLDNPSVSLEQTMVAMQKSQIGFQAALTVRNQFVKAYTDIMNMQV